MSLLTKRRLAMTTAAGVTHSSAVYCMRFRLVDLLAHGKITLHDKDMRGLHRFTDIKGLIGAASDQAFGEARKSFIDNVAGLYKKDAKRVTSLLGDVERQWVASRVSKLVDHSRWLSERTYITSANICDVRVLLQRPEQQSSGSKELLWEVCPIHQIPGDFTVQRL